MKKILTNDEKEDLTREAEILVKRLRDITEKLVAGAVAEAFDERTEMCKAADSPMDAVLHALGSAKLVAAGELRAVEHVLVEVREAINSIAFGTINQFGAFQNCDRAERALQSFKFASQCLSSVKRASKE